MKKQSKEKNQPSTKKHTVTATYVIGAIVTVFLLGFTFVLFFHQHVSKENTQVELESSIFHLEKRQSELRESIASLEKKTKFLFDSTLKSTDIKAEVEMNDKKQDENKPNLRSRDKENSAIRVTTASLLSTPFPAPIVFQSGDPMSPSVLIVGGTGEWLITNSHDY